MLVIIGHSDDRDVHDLAQYLRAAVLTPRDFVSPGWLMPFPHWEQGRAVIGSAPISVSEITAIVTRLSRVALSDLPCIREADRNFAAREIQALLLAWLTQCRCPVINRPSGLSLSGEIAPAAMMPIGISTSSPPLAETRRLSVSIIAGQVVELCSEGPMMLSRTQSTELVARISEWATTVQPPLVGVELQVTCRGDWRITDVHTLPRLTSHRARDVLGRYLDGRYPIAGRRERPLS